MREISYDKRENKQIIAVLMGEIEKFKKNDGNLGPVGKTWEKIKGDINLKKEHLVKIYDHLLNDGILKIQIDKETVPKSLSFITDKNESKEMRNLFYQDAAFRAVFNDRFPDVQLNVYPNQEDLFYHLGLDLLNSIRDNPNREVWVYHGSTLGDFAAAFNVSDFHLNIAARSVLDKCKTVFNDDIYGVFVPTIGNLVTHKSNGNLRQSRNNSNSIASALNRKIYSQEMDTLQIRAQAYFSNSDQPGIDVGMVMRYFKNFPIYMRLFPTSVFPHTLLFSLGGVDHSNPDSTYKYQVLSKNENNILKVSGADSRIFGSFFKCMDDVPYQIRKDIVSLSINDPCMRDLHERYFGLEIEQAAKIARNHMLTLQGLGNVCVIRDTDDVDCSHKIRSLMAALSLRLDEGPLINRVYLTRKCYQELTKWFTL